MPEEEAKAVQEVAKTVGKGLDVAEKVSGFLKMIFGDAFKELGASLHDWCKYFRYTQLLRIQHKVSEIHRERGIEGGVAPIPLRYAIPLIQGASQEDEDTIQDLWAGLIANTTDPERRLTINKVYIQILTALEPLDALLLRFIVKRGSSNVFQTRSSGLDLDRICEDIDMPKSQLGVSVQNLIRLGCVREVEPSQTNVVDIPGIGPRNNFTSYFRFMPTALGFSLVQACDI